MTSYSTSQALLLILLVFLQTSLKADSIPEIVAKTKPAIVEIITTDETGKPKSLGTGFFVSPDGLVVTNQHVIEGANSISAISNNGSIFLFDGIVAKPSGVDLAILKFHATDVPFLKLSQSATAVEGQKVIVIGNPTGLTGTVSDGIISAFRDSRSLIQITAPISHGSSGSPVMDETGQVIGVATLQSAEGQNLNFAIPVEKVSTTLIQLPSGQSANSAATPTPANEAKTYVHTGVVSLNRQEYDKAITNFTEAIRRDPNYALAYGFRGEAYFLHGDIDKAIRDYTKAILINPNDAGDYRSRVDAYIKQSEFDKAIRDYTEAIRIDPNNTLTYIDRGEAYADHGEFDKAIRDYTEAIRIAPNDADAYRHRADAYLRAGDREKAKADFATAKRLQSKQ